MSVAAEARVQPRRRSLTLRAAPLQLLAGLAILGALVLLGVMGPIVVGRDGLRLGLAGYSQPPSAAHLLGSDATGRDVFVVLVHGLLPTLVIGLIAGGVATLLGTTLGLVSGYVQGPLDSLISAAADIALTIPPLAVLVVVTALFRAQTIEMMAVIVGLTIWPYPTRAIRAQTLSLRERGYVTVARLSGAGSAEIAVRELLPNLIPYVTATFIGAVSGSILAAVGVQLLGLGPITTPTLGLMLEYAFEYGAVIGGLWWWWLPPTVVLVALFVSLYLVSLSVDAWVNPRLQRRVQP